MNFVKKYIGVFVGAIVLLVYLLSLNYSVSDDLETSFNEYNMVDVQLSLVKWLIITLILLSVGFFVYKVIQNPKSGIRPAIGVAIVAILWFISYSSSSADVTDINTGAIPFTASEYQLVGGMVVLTGVLIALGVLALAVFGIKRAIENATS